MDGLASYDSDSSEISADLRAQENLLKKSFECGAQISDERMKLVSEKIEVYPSPPKLVSREEYANFTEPNDGNYDSPPLLSRSDSPSQKHIPVTEQYIKHEESNGTEFDLLGTREDETPKNTLPAVPLLENLQETEKNVNIFYDPTEPLPDDDDDDINVSKVQEPQETTAPVISVEQPETKEILNESLGGEGTSASESRSPSKEKQLRSRSRSRSKERKRSKRRSRSRSKRSKSRSGGRNSRSRSREKGHRSRSKQSRSRGRRSRSRGRRSRSRVSSRRRSRSRSNSRSMKKRRRSRSQERRRKYRSRSREHSSRRKSSRPLVDEFGRDLSSRKRSVSPKARKSSPVHKSKDKKKHRSRSPEDAKKPKSDSSDEDSGKSRSSSHERSKSPKERRARKHSQSRKGRDSASESPPKFPKRRSKLQLRNRSRSPKRRERKKSRSPSPRRKLHSSSPQKRSWLRSRSRSPKKNSRSRSPHKRSHSRSPKNSCSRSPRKRSHSRSPKKNSRSRSPGKRSHSRSPVKRRPRNRSKSRSRTPRRKRRDERLKRSHSPRGHRDRRSPAGRSRSRSPFYGRGRRGGGGAGYDSAIHAQEALARRLEKAKKIQDQKRKEEVETRAAATEGQPKKTADEISKALSSMTGANAQLAFQAAYAELQAKALATTGIAVPSYYNPMAVNPLQYAQKARKRQLLWSKKTPAAEQTEDTTPSSNKWERTSFGDEATSEKFRRLMGIKADSVVADEDVKKQEDERTKLFTQLDQEYHVARVKTHTQRSFGLGFGSGAPGPGPSTE